MSKNTIKIDGEKLRTLLENTTGKTLTDIALENGFSKNLISEACRKEKASPVVQNIAKLYGISPEAYKAKDPDIREATQITIDEIETDPQISRELIKEAIKDALEESMPYFTTIISKAMSEAFKTAVFEAFEDNVPYLVAEFGKSSKGNIKAAVRETLISFGWTMKGDKK